MAVREVFKLTSQNTIRDFDFKRELSKFQPIRLNQPAESGFSDADSAAASPSAASASVDSSDDASMHASSPRPDTDERLADSVKAYNNALESLKTGNSDIAAIGLKKALSLNPNLFAAYNLLGISCIAQDRKEDAIAYFNKAASADRDSAAAGAFLKMLGDETSIGMTSVPKSPDAPEKVTRRSSASAAAGSGYFKKSARSAQSAQPAQPRQSGSGARKTGILAFADNEKVLKYLRKGNSHPFLAGVVCCALVFIILIISGIFGGSGGSPPGNTLSGTDLQTALDTLTAQYNKLENEFSALTEDYENLKAENDMEKNHIKLFQIDSLLAAKQYEEAADMLALMEPGAFDAEGREKYDALIGSVIPYATAKVISEGYRKFESGSYSESLAKYLKVLKYDPKYARLDQVYYYIGKCYMKMDDKSNAILNFQKVADNYPDSSYSKYSQSWIDQLNTGE